MRVIFAKFKFWEYTWGFLIFCFADSTAAFGLWSHFLNYENRIWNFIQSCWLLIHRKSITYLTRKHGTWRKVSSIYRTSKHGSCFSFIEKVERLYDNTSCHSTEVALKYGFDDVLLLPFGLAFVVLLEKSISSIVPLMRFVVQKRTVKYVALRTVHTMKK